ncbi:hypothetical protein D918_06961 [Trichuris suis]|nr:hypothetical protein D918_06961 [Trichuris suis]
MYPLETLALMKGAGSCAQINGYASSTVYKFRKLHPKCFLGISFSVEIPDEDEVQGSCSVFVWNASTQEGITIPSWVAAFRAET